MASRTYDITLPCGCMLSPGGGGGLIPCHGGVGFNSTEQEAKHRQSWLEFKESGEEDRFDKEVERLNS